MQVFVHETRRFNASKSSNAHLSRDAQLAHRMSGNLGLRGGLREQPIYFFAEVADALDGKAVIFRISPSSRTILCGRRATG